MADGQTIYGFVVNLLVTTSMSESFDIVVFHVMEDGETVVDRAHIKVHQCFDNQVSRIESTQVKFIYSDNNIEESSPDLGISKQLVLQNLQELHEI